MTSAYGQISSADLGPAKNQNITDRKQPSNNRHVMGPFWFCYRRPDRVVEEEREVSPGLEATTEVVS